MCVEQFDQLMRRSACLGSVMRPDFARGCRDFQIVDLLQVTEPLGLDATARGAWRRPGSSSQRSDQALLRFQRRWWKIASASPPLPLLGGRLGVRDWTAQIFAELVKVHFAAVHRFRMRPSSGSRPGRYSPSVRASASSICFHRSAIPDLTLLASFPPSGRRIFGCSGSPPLAR